jgi:hypothetical protein
MIRLHPDVVAAKARGADKEHHAGIADASMRDLLRVVAALEVLAVEPAGTQAELEQAMQRRKSTGGASAGHGRSKDWVRGTALLGATSKLSIRGPAAAKAGAALDAATASRSSAAGWADEVIEVSIPASLLHATKASEEHAHKQEMQGIKPDVAVLSSPGHEEHGVAPTPENTVIVGAAVVESATLCAPSLRAKWLELATRFASELCTALGIDGVTSSTLRITKTVKALASRGTAQGTATGPAADAARRLPQAERVGLEARARRKLSQVQAMLDATDHRTPHSLGKIRPNPWQPLDQERVTTAEERDSRIAGLISHDRLSFAFIEQDRFRTGRDALVAVLYQHFEAIQLQDPFWSLAKFVIAAGYHWEPSQLTVYLPWNAHTRELASYLRDLAPTVLAEARRQSRNDLRSSQHRKEADSITRGLQEELERQQRVRARRQAEANKGAEGGGRDATERQTPWAGQWKGLENGPIARGQAVREDVEMPDAHTDSDSEGDEARLRAFGASVPPSKGSVDGHGLEQEDYETGVSAMEAGIRSHMGVGASPLSSRVLAALARKQEGIRQHGDGVSRSSSPQRASARFARNAFESGWDRV